MQGRKQFTPQLFYQTSLESLVPKDNFYRILLTTLDLHFLYSSTGKYYGSEGQESIDPVVFFKILLVGYLNNINSDRALLRFCADSLSIRLFLGYDLNEELPWHSTISRTRKLYGEEVFLDLFRKVLYLCIEKGMVRGKRQAVDSAFIKANASMDSLLEKEVLEDASAFVNELEENSEYKVTSERKKLVERHHAWKKEAYKDMPANSNSQRKDEDGEEIRPKYLSNHTHYSPTDPDAKISTKPGKPRQLNYAGQLAVDDAHHVITGACASTAGSKDSTILHEILDQTISNFHAHEMEMEELIADAGYSSGEALQYLEDKGINAWIPNFGQYKAERAGFTYNTLLNRYECHKADGNKAILLFKGTKTDSKGYSKHIYRSSERDCGNCPLRAECCGKVSRFKKLDDSIHKPLYDKMHQKLSQNKAYHRRLVKRRSSTVEPVLGTLLNHHNMKRLNSRGMAQANKHVLMAALCYNLKKYLKFERKKPQLLALAKAKLCFFKKRLYLLVFSR
ncbi:transposase IS4 family protein [Pseudopedobacter saltans DSM 12145]|uniref:Transposase IS4 family protein n=1 Tax=Pseudopedobacter saltans (strain ATCC 51119 / DSM 12145 / JCM 21818 / CCUG 39354 / LMG 10337 / NBRC 100064 / NCIMB 13643) TaxID=762903 RepID=F0S6U9_PSESL|nr:IS1182 family transposase [Pseudopedobacter saltans]ADY52209.1 transposase IS4 family protein [Pseudopedobacter saltans DSM 12145]